MPTITTDAAKTADWIYREGTDFMKDIAVENADTSAYDFTGHTATFDVYKTTGGSALVSFSSGAGLTLSSGEIALDKAAASMAALSANEKYYIELVVTDASSDVHAWLAGYLTVTNRVVEEGDATTTLTINPTGGANLTLTISPPGGAAGATTWAALTDTPGSITADQYVKGDSGGTALEFIATTSMPFIPTAGTKALTADVTISGIFDFILGTSGNPLATIGLYASEVVNLGAGGGIATAVQLDGTNVNINEPPIIGGNMLFLDNYNLTLGKFGDLIMSGGTSGTITFTPAAVAGTNTITVPASTGTMALTSDLSAYAAIGGAHHDGFSDFVANEHIDWTAATQNLVTSGTINANGNYLYLDNLNQVFVRNNGGNMILGNAGATTLNLSTNELISVKNANAMGIDVGQATSATNPIFCPSRAAMTSGLGGAVNAPAIIVSGSSVMTWNATSAVVDVPIGLKSYTVATLPTATATYLIYVSDETGGATVAFADGTNWRRVQDRAVVS